MNTHHYSDLPPFFQCTACEGYFTQKNPKEELPIISLCPHCHEELAVFKRGGDFITTSIEPEDYDDS